ncbi:GMC oxidoreductase [Neptunicella sp. SCSIO 80796]|uniref:GMC oxidoreductase n=1 Tax=Neptunicella plasticusilytica TaxID=3117012 RepID=UPI003A4E404B
MIDPFLVTKTNKNYDAIVVGSGISGGWVAKELCEKGLKVLMVERGRAVRHQKDYVGEGKAPWDMPHSGFVEHNLIEDQFHVQRKCYAFNDMTKQFFGNDRDYPYQTEQGTQFDWIRANQLGGRSLLWHRQSFRWSEIDFEENLRDGHGTDWPIRYQDLAPWYSHVEKFVGISGSVENIATLPDSEFLPPFELNAVERYAKQQIEKKYPDRKMIQGRCAHLSEPTQFFLDQGRYKCMARNECQRGCSFGAYFSTLSSTLPAAIKTNNLQIACNSVVHSLIYDGNSNRVTGVNVIDEQTMETREYHANMVFMCASTIGTAQIMLNSTSEHFPTGIANSSGVLGRYLMDHIYNPSASGEIEGFDDDYYKGRRPTGPIIPRFNNLQKQTDKFSRGYFLRGGASRSGVFHAMDSDEFGASLKQKMQQPGPWHFGWSGSGEMLPQYDNKVTLHTEKVDKWGMPQLLIDCKWGENDKLMMEKMADDCVEILEAIGAKNIKRRISDAPPGLAIHEMGTARMGRDAKTSVLNGNNQCHDIPNLFITDGACMPSSGHVNPSLTYMALSARAANIAVDLYKQKLI